eukprot:TRINITY_DN3620_c0_g1_i1.p2 TRINITY_DN3620_c0_g1~~TRINITY_DN3620_c0_g1_i1.p2  ORF type:complete len:115 (+),score=17.21 TRINITY_DN3620_c0_g1_i1:118-462(+)
MSGGLAKDAKDTTTQEKVPTGVDKLATVLVTEMPEDLQQRAIEYANQALDKFREGFTTQQREVAMHVKKEFDKNHGKTWHCIFGREFGAYVKFESRCIVHIQLGQHFLLLWKHG